MRHRVIRQQPADPAAPSLTAAPASTAWTTATTVRGGGPGPQARARPTTTRCKAWAMSLVMRRSFATGAARRSCRSSLDGCLPFVAAQSLPPQLPAIASSGCLRATIAVAGLMPLRRDLGEPASDAVIEQNASTGTDGATVAPDSAVLHRRVPYMTTRSAPPHLQVRSRRNLIGAPSTRLRQIGVQLARKLRELRCEAPLGQDRVTAAEPGPVPVHAALDRRTPRVAARSEPPHFGLRSGHEAPGSQVTVQPVPLRSELRKPGSETVFGRHQRSAAIRTAQPPRPARNHSEPRVATGTEPPHLGVRVRPNVSREKRALNSGCHCAARSGNFAARLCSGDVCDPLQNGQPCPPDRSDTAACHT